MDDYNISAISEAKNEYSARLVNILTPLLIEGIRSIFKEALELCISNDEKNKYLMTFQNFLTRVPKWNQTIINQEAKRIVTKSGCVYLEDLITCVHISQLKILTSIRVASKQKKVDIDIPKISIFVHNCYIQFARKLYSNIYLFETKIPSLQIQKNHRECELICKECILNVIRDNIPVDKILRAYIDETIEEEIVMEQKLEEKSIVEENTESPQNSKVADNKSEISKEVTAESKVTKVPQSESGRELNNKPTKKTVETPKAEETKEEANIKEKTPLKASNLSPSLPTSVVTPPLMKSVPNTAPVPSHLSFNDKDKVLNYNQKENVANIKTHKVETIVAPKTLQRLEAISAQRHKERREEDAKDNDDEKIKILDTPTELSLDVLDIHVLDDNVKLQKEVLSNVVELK